MAPPLKQRKKSAPKKRSTAALKPAQPIVQQVDVVMQLSSKLPDLVYKHFFHHCLTK